MADYKSLKWFMIFSSPLLLLFKLYDVDMYVDYNLHI